MGITQLNTADFDYEMMLNVINKAYKGKADITISEYDTTAAPAVKVGSVFDINGAIFIVDTSDITPSGYGGISNSTTFYLYYDESANAFIYSSTAPSWNDAFQGWYNSNDRAFFSMFKDSGGTLYQLKAELANKSKNQLDDLTVQNDLTVNNNITTIGGIDAGNNGVYLKTKVIEIGNWNMVSTDTINVAHGLDVLKIRSISVFIRNDLDTSNSSLVGSYTTVADNYRGGYISTNSTEIVLARAVGGVFDTASYNETPLNRGWITIIYEV